MTDVPHGRLALLLLDNAAETLLMRSAESSRQWADMYRGMLRGLRPLDTGDIEGQRFVRELESKTLLKTYRRRIERDFDTLVNYVFGQDDSSLDPSFATCFKILHRYRNAAYHRDTVRADVLGPAVQVLFSLCCQLLRNARSTMWEIAAPPPGIMDVFGGHPLETPWPSGAISTKDLHGLVAGRLLADMELDHFQVAVALSDHLVARLDVLERGLDEIGNAWTPVPRSVTLRLVQLAPDDPDEAAADPPPDFWTRPLTVTLETLDTWRFGAVSIRDVPVAHDALQAFAAIEIEVAKLDEPVARFLEEIDREVQRIIDERRGK
jgi:hypothetical protein